MPQMDYSCQKEFMNNSKNKCKVCDKPIPIGLPVSIICYDCLIKRPK